jgi:hypothetical protein
MLDETGGGQAFTWRVMCVSGADPLAQAPAPPGPAGQWRTFSAGFMVPASACPAQWLDLAAEEGDLPKDITVWYDDLTIEPGGAVAPKTQMPAHRAQQGESNP